MPRTPRSIWPRIIKPSSGPARDGLVARRSAADTTHLTPVEQAELARRVVDALGRIEDRIVAARPVRWGSRPAGGTRSAAMIDASTDETTPGIADEVAHELAARLPPVLRRLGRHRPRMALILYDDALGDHGHMLDLVRVTHRELGGSPRHPSALGCRPPTEPVVTAPAAVPDPLAAAPDTDRG